MTGVRGGTESNPVVVMRTQGSPKLVVVKGPSKGRAFALVRTRAIVGRHPTSDFVVDDPRVSGAHLELVKVDDRVRVRDISSTNGTWLGAHKLLDAELSIGAEVTIGDSVIRFELDECVLAPIVYEHEAFGEFVGRKAAVREIFATLERVTKKNLSVLFQGEPGTGKEELARAVHRGSPQASGPFVAVEAAALPDALAEEILFGHEAEENADVATPQVGALERANGGTIFIGGVDELPPPLQAKLLRALERREIVRVGGHAPVPIDVRVLASTVRELRNAIDKGLFLEDLYLRLAQVRVSVPPLRERREDIPLLCSKLLARARSEATIDAEALEYLTSMPWPGNVRELDSVLIRATTLARDQVVRRSDVAGEGDGFRGADGERVPLDLTGTFAQAKERAIERFEKAYLSLLMRRARGNLSAAARQADVARHHLRDLLRKRGLYGVSRDDG